MRTQVEWNVDTHIARGPRAHQRDHPLAHLGGGLVGERDGQHLPDADVAGGQQVGDPTGQHRGLARSGAGHDEQRRALVQHRLALLRVEAFEKLVVAGLSRLRAHSCRSQLTAEMATFFALAAA